MSHVNLNVMRISQHPRGAHHAGMGEGGRGRLSAWPLPPATAPLSLPPLPLPSKIRARQALAYYATHTTTFGTFVAVLCASRRPRDPPAAGAAADSEVAGGAVAGAARRQRRVCSGSSPAGGAAAKACLLWKLAGNEDLPFFRLIAEFAGVQMGPEASRHKATLNAP